MRAKTSFGRLLKTVSVRDVFPKDKLNDVRILVQKGVALKKDGRVATFKVVARGPGVIPVLEVREVDSDGRMGKWEVYKIRASSPEMDI